MIGKFLFIGLVAGLLGLFYRNCLKGDGQILFPFYTVLSRWADQAEFCRDFRDIAEEDGMNIPKTLIMGWIAYPLGYCIYCSTPWISILSYIIYLCSWEKLPSWHWIFLGLITVISVSHLVVLLSCKFILKGHPDFDPTPKSLI